MAAPSAATTSGVPSISRVSVRSAAMPTTDAESALTICGAPKYMSESHASLPHIVKFSGGRVKRGDGVEPRPQRRDPTPSGATVVLFANTTAEHPATYDFAAQGM